MSTENQIAVQDSTFVKASTALSHQLGLEPQAMVDALKSQFFKGKEATNAQLAIVVSIARELKLNPLIPGQLYPYPDRSGSVVVMLGPDGIFTLLANNPDIVAQKDGGAAYWTEHGKDADGAEICTGYINHRTKGLLKKTIWVSEWVVSSNPNWSARKHHMAEIRALKQAARMVIHGIPADADEQKLGDMLNVTQTTDEQPAQPVVDRPAPKPRATKGAAAARAEVVVTQEEQKEAEVAPVENIQQAMEAREAKLVAPVATPFVPRAFLKDGEKFEASIEVVSFTAETRSFGGVAKCAVVATVKGDFNGVVRDINSGTLGVNDAKGIPTAISSPLWVAGSRLKVSLEGRLSKAKQGDTVGKVLVYCEQLEAAPSQAADGDE